MRARLTGHTLTLAVMVAAASLTAQAQSNDIFSPEAVAREIKALSRLKPPNKLKARLALNLLHRAVTFAGVSNDRREIAAANARAAEAVDDVSPDLPDGVLKGALESCRKALGHYFILRLVNVGALDPAEIAENMEEIVLRYRLAGVPAYERAARVLDFARAQLLVADRVSVEASIVQKKRLKGKGHE